MKIHLPEICCYKFITENNKKKQVLIIINQHYNYGFKILHLICSLITQFALDYIRLSHPLSPGSTLDTSPTWAQAGGTTEESRPHTESNRVPDDPIWDPHGRHTLEAVQVETSHCGRLNTPTSQEGRPRHHPRVHPVQAAPQEGKVFISVLITIF